MKYVDVDKLLSRLPDDLPYKASVKKVLIQAPAADVIPKSAIEKIMNAVDKVISEVKVEVAKDIFAKLNELERKHTAVKPTDDKIIKLLECCVADDCDNCPSTFGNCEHNAMRGALDLIQRQRAEFEAMSETYSDLVESLRLANEANKDEVCI